MRSGTPGQDGFSLIELLVVLVIVALGASLIVASLPPPVSPAQRSAELLLRQIETAQEHALLANVPTALDIGPNESRLLEHAGRTWRPVEADQSIRAGQIVLWSGAVGVTGDPGPLPLWIEFDPTGFNSEARILFSDGTQTRIVRLSGAGDAVIERLAS